MTLGEKIKELRKAQKITQRDLGQRIGVENSVVSYYESGERYPSYDVLIKIAQCFHVTTDYLLGIERNRTLDVSDLTDTQVGVVQQMIDVLTEQNK